MRGGALGPFAYVMPALSKTGENAAFYSDTFRPAGVTRLKIGRDDARRARRRAVLPLPRRCGRRPMAAPAAATSCPRRPWSPSRSRWRRSASTARCSRPSPIPRPISSCSGRSPARPRTPKTTSRAFALRLRPNQDFAGALEAFCRQHGIAARANSRRRRQHHRRALRGRPQRRAVRDRTCGHAPASIAPGAGGTLEAELDIALVDYLGGIAEGRLHARRQSGADDDGAGAGGAVSSPWLRRGRPRLRRVHHLANSIVMDGGRAWPVIGRAFARPVGCCPHQGLCPRQGLLSLQQWVTRFRG